MGVVSSKERYSMPTLEEAKHTAADLAIGDLMGWSQPAEGLEDAYPFNADAYARSLPPVMCNEVLEVVAYVYHNERRPDAN